MALITSSKGMCVLCMYVYVCDVILENCDLQTSNLLLAYTKDDSATMCAILLKFLVSHLNLNWFYVFLMFTRSQEGIWQA